MSTWAPKVCEDDGGGGNALLKKKNKKKQWLFFLPTPGLVISVAGTSPHDIYDNPIRLSAAVSQTPKLFFFWSTWYSGDIVKCVDCLFIFLTGHEDLSGFAAFFFFFFFVRWLKATAGWAWIQNRAQACWSQHCCSSSSMRCGEDMFWKYMYAGHIHPTRLSLVKQSCQLCLMYTVWKLFSLLCSWWQGKCVAS